MRIIVFSICYNQADILPWWLRHYSTFADEISVFDDHSTDGSREMLKACPKVLLRDWPYDNGIDDRQFLEFSSEWSKKAIGNFDWAIWVDTDEFVWSADPRKTLESAGDCQVIRTFGYNMIGDGLPQDDGHSQIWQVHKMGVKAPIYSKSIVYRPDANIKWNLGKHGIENSDVVIGNKPLFKLFHYRYMGRVYTSARNAKNYARCCLRTGDKNAAWTCVPGYKGEHSAEWSEYAKQFAYNVVDEPL